MYVCIVLHYHATELIIPEILAGTQAAFVCQKIMNY